MKRLMAFFSLLIAVLLLTACSVKNTCMEFSFNSSTPYDTEDEKAFCFNNDYETATLNANLQIDSGNLLINIFDTNNEIVFSNTYETSGDYEIKIENVTAKDEYTLKVTAEQTKNITLKITSPLKLINDIENSDISKPEKPIA